MLLGSIRGSGEREKIEREGCRLKKIGAQSGFSYSKSSTKISSIIKKPIMNITDENSIGNEVSNFTEKPTEYFIDIFCQSYHYQWILLVDILRAFTIHYMLDNYQQSQFHQ
ncbi:Uncharacterized protein TCM_003675 [Theobroma cacao]|uniref:Uncharacterized protein n=1 Tax=Theobroma cacao TaxID=3641 RepID=A0A061DNF7_THECC|nr:Uncharacterized protein TCM_003675 [Theobroma cacao]